MSGKSTFAAALAAGIVLNAAGSARAANDGREIRLINHGYAAIEAVTMAPAGTYFYSPVRLPGSIEPGSARKVAFKNMGTGCRFDLLLKMSDGSTITANAVNLCTSTGLTVHT